MPVPGRLLETVREALETFLRSALDRGFEEAAAAVDVYESVMVKFANSIVTVVQTWVGADAEMYLARKGRVYVVERQVTGPADVERLVSDALRVVEVSEPAKPYAPLPEPTGKPLEALSDRSLEEKMDRAAELAEEVIDAGTRVDSRVRMAGMVEVSTGVRIVYTSRGARLEEPYTSLEAYARALVDDASGHWAYTTARYELEGLRRVGETAASFALEASRKPAVKPEPGFYQALLSPLVVGNLVGDLAWMASGLAVLMGFSVFAKHGVGSRIGSERVTVVDNPHDPDLPGSTGFDDEGVATIVKPVIEKGVVKSILHNTKTAAAMKTSSTGNAGYVMPRPWNVIVEPGDSDYDEMVAEIRRGFIVLNNWYTRFQNYYEGVFSTVTRDALLYVENGEIKGAVARLRIADTVPSMLSAVTLVGKEVFKVRWWEVPFPTKAPYMLVEKLRFTIPEA